MLENIFGKDVFHPKDIKDRVKTFEDAVSILGNDNQAVIDYYIIADKTCIEDIIAFGKLRVIAETLNEGWKPTFKEHECHYYPWFYIYTKKEYDNLNEDKKKLYSVINRYNNANMYDNFIYVHVDADVVSSHLCISKNGSRSNRKACRRCS